MKIPRQPLIIAHRGFSGKHPENSIEAIEAAIELGVDFVEIDVQETKDGKLVVFHDFGLKRICGVRGRVHRSTLERLQSLNPSVPTFREVLACCRGRMKLLVEIKRADPAKVAAEIAGAGMERDIVVFSLSVKQTAQMEDCLPQVFRAGLIARRLQTNLKRVQQATSVRAVGLNRLLIKSRATVERLHRSGLMVFVWTVNDVTEMKRFVAWGVDGLITNWPDRALQVVKGQRR